jgi:hypothetical protein
VAATPLPSNWIFTPFLFFRLSPLLLISSTWNLRSRSRCGHPRNRALSSRRDGPRDTVINEWDVGDGINEKYVKKNKKNKRGCIYRGDTGFQSGFFIALKKREDSNGICAPVLASSSEPSHTSIGGVHAAIGAGNLMMIYPS